MADSTTVERRLVTKPFPSLEELESTILAPLDAAHNAFQEFEMFLRNAVGEIKTTHWEARLKEPPTIENIGTVAIVADVFETRLAFFAREVELLKGLIPSLDDLRLAGDVRMRGDDA